MLYKTGRAYGSHTNKGANMKEEWKWLRVTEEDIINGIPDSCVNCPIALAMGRELEKDEELKNYRANVGGESMLLEHREDERTPIQVELYEPTIHIYKDFIWEFDMTESDPDAPKPSTMGFKYRIKKEQK